MPKNVGHQIYICGLCQIVLLAELRGYLNIKRIKEEYDLSMSELMLRPHNMIRHKMHTQYNDSNVIAGEEWIISVILELMDCKRGGNLWT